MTSEVPPHGTYARYQRERREGTDPCDQCNEANAEYVARWRKGSGGANHRRLALARGRALQALRLAHRDEFRALYEAEKERIDREADR